MTTASPSALITLPDLGSVLAFRPFAEDLTYLALVPVTPALLVRLAAAQSAVQHGTMMLPLVPGIDVELVDLEVESVTRALTTAEGFVVDPQSMLDEMEDDGVMRVVFTPEEFAPLAPTCFDSSGRLRMTDRRTAQVSLVVNAEGMSVWVEVGSGYNPVMLATSATTAFSDRLAAE